MLLSKGIAGRAAGCKVLSPRQSVIAGHTPARYEVQFWCKSDFLCNAGVLWAVAGGFGAFLRCFNSDFFVFMRVLRGGSGDCAPEKYFLYLFR